jgi:hypothetical protein
MEPLEELQVVFIAQNLVAICQGVADRQESSVVIKEVIFIAHLGSG